jgi:hypothetical protein
MDKTMEPIKTTPFFHPLSRRMYVIFVLMIGCFCMAYTRSNLGMTMTCIVNSTAVALERKLNTQNDGLFDAKALEMKQEAMRCSSTNHSGNAIPVNNYGVSISWIPLYNHLFQGEIIWDANTQNMIFTGTFWGSLLSTLPAGYLADRTSPVNLLQIAAILLAITSAVFPYLALNFNHYAVFASRFITGIGGGESL